MMTMTMDMVPNLTGWQGERQLPDNPTMSTWDERHEGRDVVQ